MRCSGDHVPARLAPEQNARALAVWLMSSFSGKLHQLEVLNVVERDLLVFSAFRDRLIHEIFLTRRTPITPPVFCYT